MLDFSKIDLIKSGFDKHVKMSFQMETEFTQILKYLIVNSVDAEAFLNSFMKDRITENGVICKNDAKKLLRDLRGEAIGKTALKRTERAEKTGFSGKKIKAFVEEDVLDDPMTEKLVKRADQVIPIRHYKDVFNAKAHDFKTEKKSGDFIVAKNRDRLLYPGAPFCQNFGNEHFYYASCVKNCIYDCDYCFLQGLYPCGYPVYFVNLEDYFKELDGLLIEFPVYLCISYDTDLLAMEPVLGYVEKWVGYAQSRPNLKIEIRTKSGNASVFDNILGKKIGKFAENHNNIIFAWTISPKDVTDIAETGLPSVEKRLDALLAAKKAGFPVRLCFDPMIWHPEWKNSYSALFEEVFDRVKPEDVLDLSVGVFRISNGLLKRMRDANPESPITQFPYITEKGACHYGELSAEMMGFAVKELQRYVPKEKIFTWEGN